MENTPETTRLLDLARMTTEAAQELSHRLDLGSADNRRASHAIIFDYLQNKTADLPQEIIVIKQYALSDFFAQGQRYLEAIMYLAPMPYQVRSATVLGRLLWELHTNAIWLNQGDVDQQRTRILSWLEWQRFMIKRCNCLPTSEDAIEAHLELEKDEKNRLEKKYGKDNCFHRGINQKSKAVEEYVWYIKLYRTYSLFVHGELPASRQLLDPAGVLFFAVRGCYGLGRIFSDVSEGIDLFNEIYRPVAEKMDQELDKLGTK